MDLNDFKDVPCGGCGNLEFVQVLIVKIVPAIMSKDGREQIAPVPSRVVCAQCGKDLYETVQELEKEAPAIIL